MKELPVPIEYEADPDVLEKELDILPLQGFEP
jgi:hypothetical protein